MKWIKQQPGTLVLEGTIMSVVYKAGNPGGDFLIFQGDRFKYQCMTLACAKRDAEQFYAELVEIGVQEFAR